MRNIYKCDPHALLDILQFVLHVLAQTKIERAERLVKKQYLRAVDQCARDSHALLLAAGKGRDLAVFKALETDDFQHFCYTIVNFLFRKLGNTQTERDVVVHVEVREQRVPLEHGVDLPLVGRYIVDALAVEQYIAGCGRKKAADDPEHCGFSASAGTQQSKKFLVIDVQVDVVENRLSVLECHGEIREANELVGHVSSPISKKFVCAEPCRNVPKHTR